MLINLSEIISRDNSIESINAQLDINHITFNKQKIQLVDGIAVVLRVKDNDEHSVNVTGSIKTKLQLNCDRCNVPLNYSLYVEFSKFINLGDTKDAEDEFEGIVSGSMLDVDTFAQNEIYLNFPMKVLCNEQCNGVCQICGINLNEKSCTCEKNDIDPRWLGLKNLYDEKFKEV
ncbi:MAG: DUF177 domain-containing protein [Vallitaleaceae bacterium]|nr:DUF177 domain-containing protein [Vallitaleaceae bacterium]